MRTDYMNNLSEQIDYFQSISLAELDQIALLNRTDTKFVIPFSLLPHILEVIQPFYSVLELENRRIFNYETRYFDTQGYQLYEHHHNGKPNRFKVRCRRYTDTGLTFFEIKTKQSGIRTFKIRTKRDDFNAPLSSEEHAIIPFVNAKVPILNETLQTHFQRITLARKDFTERVTIDFKLQFVHQHQRKDCFDCAIVEVKQDAESRKSPFIQALRTAHQYPISFSKYAIGLAEMIPQLKRNAFKPTFLHLQKIQSNL